MHAFVPAVFFGAACAIVSSAVAAELQVAVDVAGIENEDLRDYALSFSALASTKDTYAALAPVKRMAEKDAQNLQGALHAKGYYAAEVRHRVRRDDLDVAVVYTVTLGPLFAITGYKIDYADTVESDRPVQLTDAGLAPSNSPAGDDIRALESGLLTYLWNNGYPSAESGGRYVEANFADGNREDRFPDKVGGPRALWGYSGRRKRQNPGRLYPRPSAV